MLGRKETMATVAVKDLDAARSFYERTLELKVLDTEGSEAMVYETGSSKLLVYRSEYAGTNRATAVTWNVGKDLDGIVRTLRGKGVTFEHYPDLPGVKLEGDIHSVDGEMRSAWFKDPAGNIIALVSD